MSKKKAEKKINSIKQRNVWFVENRVTSCRFIIIICLDEMDRALCNFPLTVQRFHRLLSVADPKGGTRDASPRPEFFNVHAVLGSKFAK